MRDTPEGKGRKSHFPNRSILVPELARGIFAWQIVGENEPEWRIIDDERKD